MAVLSRGNLFQPEIVSEIINKVYGESALIKLSKQSAIPFNGQKEFIFTMDSEIDVVAENGKKSHGGISLEPITIVPIKVEYGARISDEFLYASDEEKINILQSFTSGYAKKLAKGLDLMAMHGINPRTGNASTVIGVNHFDSLATQTIEFTADPLKQNLADEVMEEAIDLIDGAERDTTGIVSSKTFAKLLAKTTVDAEGKGAREYPELKKRSRGTVDFNGRAFETTNGVDAYGNDLVILGDFENAFKWGYSKQIPFKVLDSGDPDGSGQDLANYNQVYLRSETYLGWGILDPSSFARIITA